MSGSQCLKPHTSCILELVPKPFSDIANSSIWFQSWDKNFHCLELSIRCIARFVTPPFLSNYSCPFIQLITFLFSFVNPRVIDGQVSDTCFVSFIFSWERERGLAYRTPNFLIIRQCLCDTSLSLTLQRWFFVCALLNLLLDYAVVLNVNQTW